MPKHYLPKDDLAIIGGVALDMTSDEIGHIVDGRSGDGIKQRIAVLRSQGYLLPARRPGPGPRRKYAAIVNSTPHTVIKFPEGVRFQKAVPERSDAGLRLVGAAFK